MRPLFFVLPLIRDFNLIAGKERGKTREQQLASFVYSRSRNLHQMILYLGRSLKGIYRGHQSMNICLPRTILSHTSKLSNSLLLAPRTAFSGIQHSFDTSRSLHFRTFTSSRATMSVKAINSYDEFKKLVSGRFRLKS